MKTGEQNRNNKRTEIKRFDWFIERIQTHLAFGWLSERSDGKTSCPKNFLEIALTSHCNTIGLSNDAFSILGFSLAGKRRVHVCSFRTIFQGHPKIALFLRARLERTNLHFLSRAKDVKKEKRRRRRRRRRKKSVWSIVISSSSFPVSPFPFVASAIKISGEAQEKRIKRIDNREL